MSKGVAAWVVATHRDRDASRLARKLARMRADAFAFLRGTAGLFHSRMPEAALLRSAPVAWACGDAHLQNFGCYKGDDRLAYFDLNDFDEAALAPCTADPLRFLASIIVAGMAGRAPPRRTAANAEAASAAWLEALAKGKARWIERDTASGLVRALLDRVRSRSRAAFLDSRTDTIRGKRALRLDGERALPATSEERSAVAALLARVDRVGLRPRGFFRAIDVARRIAGTGSLGIPRFVALVEGKGSPDGNYLVDLKEARPSALAPWVGTRQPRWPSQAERVVAVQDCMQGVTMAFLRPVVLLGRPFVMRGLQPSEDRLDLGRSSDRPDEVREALCTMAALLAWAQLRASGRSGAAPADALTAFAGKARRERVLALARSAAERVEEDWTVYCRAYDAGRFAALVPVHP